MRVPYHLLPQVAAVKGPDSWSVDSTGQAVIDAIHETPGVPCRIEPISSDTGVVYQGRDGSVVYHGYFPSAQAMKDSFGVDDMSLGANWFVVIDDVTYRVIGPSVDLAYKHVLQRVMLETHNQTEAPAA